LNQRQSLEDEQQAERHQDRVGFQDLLVGRATDQRGKQVAIDQPVAAECRGHAEQHAGQRSIRHSVKNQNAVKALP